MKIVITFKNFNNNNKNFLKIKEKGKEIRQVFVEPTQYKHN